MITDSKTIKETTHYEIQIYTDYDGWCTSWRTYGKPQKFETLDEANTELEEFFYEIEEEIRRGYRCPSESCSFDEFRIVNILVLLIS